MSNKPRPLTSSEKDHLLDGKSMAMASSLSNAVVKFTQVHDFTTFAAEYGMKDSDLVIHFFLPEDLRGPNNYWMELFPQSLDRTARAYFMATKPRIQASYTPELKSWWFKACGYDHLIDLTRFVNEFFSLLDEDLDPLVQARS